LSKKQQVPAGFECETWPIDRPKDYPQNARKWSPQAIAKVQASIKQFGGKQAVLGDGDYKGATFEHVREGRRREAEDVLKDEALNAK
jgi:hypothetical protein